MFANIRFFSNVIEVYPVTLQNLAFLASLVIVLTCVIIFLLSLVCYKYTIKPILILILLVSSSTSYFMDTYNVIINDTMIQNLVRTDVGEVNDLINLKLILYVIFLGIIPSIFVYKVEIKYQKLKTEIFSRIKLLLVSLVMMILVIISFGNFYASFVREHKLLRFYTNPTYYIYSTGRYIQGFFKSASLPLKHIALDIKIPQRDKHKLMIFVIGEATRADRFSLNGYSRETNPLLKQLDVINFSNFWSCGTSTAYSLPCMFSIYNRSEYSNAKAQNTENVLDILQHAGVNILWRDNNSDSKGVALRVPYERFKAPHQNTICDETECRDEGMLVGLQSYIKEHKQGNILIILHQMGNHGPAYYKRYPPAFEKFTPTCKSNQLETCRKEEIENAYDNTVLYTDYFLSKVIALLKQNSEFETAMFYVSDHGESLGENGLYLHGLPYILAPDVQKHVAALMWFGKNLDEKEKVKVKLLQQKLNEKYSHDNIFHTILGFMEAKTSVYDKKMDLLH
jgi:lipid A ethanolaminephosphotransferase